MPHLGRAKQCTWRPAIMYVMRTCSPRSSPPLLADRHIHFAPLPLPPSPPTKNVRHCAVQARACFTSLALAVGVAAPPVLRRPLPLAPLAPPCVAVRSGGCSALGVRTVASARPSSESSRAGSRGFEIWMLPRTGAVFEHAGLSRPRLNVQQVGFNVRAPVSVSSHGWAAAAPRAGMVVLPRPMSRRRQRPRVSEYVSRSAHACQNVRLCFKVYACLSQRATMMLQRPNVFQRRSACPGFGSDFDSMPSHGCLNAHTLRSMFQRPAIASSPHCHGAVLRT
jgi:hypothetical protein